MSRKVTDYYPERDLVDDLGSIIITRNLTASSVDEQIFVAPFACRIASFREIHSVVGSTSAAVRPRKVTDTSAPGASASTTVKELTTAAFDLTATINTMVEATLVAAATPVTNSDYYLAQGDKLCLDFSGTLTGLVGVITVHIKRV